MKRIGNIYQQLCSMDNLLLADIRARKGKLRSYGVKLHDANKTENLIALQSALVNHTFKTSTYHVFQINYNGKVRDIYRLPYYPDRIVHHAIMNLMESVWTSIFTPESCSCIKKRGIHYGFALVKKALKDKVNTRYCLKFDIKKYYPNIDHDILKAIVRKKIKDVEFLALLDEIIDSAPGLPIGNYLSQYLSNLYLTYFDHWVKENLKVKYYFRYADDIVILHQDKQYLHELFQQLEQYLSDNLKLSVKSNYQIFPVEARGIDFLGYVFRHDYILVRKRIKQAFFQKINKLKGQITSSQLSSIESYKGWLMHCNARNLTKKSNHEIKRRSAA